jgi:hypothetical protein
VKHEVSARIGAKMSCVSSRERCRRGFANGAGGRTLYKRKDDSLHYQSFQRILCAQVQQILGDRAEVIFTQIPQNNGIVRSAILLKTPDACISPVIYLDEFYEWYGEGRSMEELARQIADLYQNGESINQLDLEPFSHYEQAKYHIFYRLINREKNYELLQDTPHFSYLDLAVVCYYRVPEGPLEGATALLKDKNLAIWKITKEDLFYHTWMNTPFRLPGIFTGMNELCKLDSEEEIMYVLTNTEKHFGAASMLYPNMLSDIGSQLGEDFYILPSSVHECIVVPVSGGYKREELQDVVAEMNRTQVEPAQVLSDHVYYYERKNRKIFV